LLRQRSRVKVKIHHHEIERTRRFLLVSTYLEKISDGIDRYFGQQVWSLQARSQNDRKGLGFSKYF
jgi:hypothetical protein